MADWPILQSLEEFYNEAGRAIPETLRFDLIRCADDDACRQLVEVLIGITCRPDGRRRKPIALRRALCAFEHVLGALGTYRAAPFLHLRGSSDLVRALDRARDRDLAHVLDKQLADPDNVAGLLAELWRGAARAGVVRQRRCGIGLVIEVRIGADWIETGTSDVAWARRLAMAPVEFRLIVKAAIASQPTKGARPDLVRRLRNLSRSPTLRRLRNLIQDAREHDVNGLDVLGSALSFAGEKERALFPEGLPRDLVQQLGGRPSDIALLAGAAHSLLQSGLRGQGRVRDAAREKYADQLAVIYAGLVRRPIAYARGSETARAEVRGSAYGIDLDFMHKGLQFLDGSETKSSAQRQIDRIRGWDKA